MAKYTDEELVLINNSYNSFVQSINNFMDAEQLGFIDKAYHFTLEKYDGRKMLSGRLYMLHLIEMAKIATIEVMGLKSKTVVGVFLHGITYKADVPLDDIREQFGDNIANIVDGYDKISRIQTTHISFQSEQFRKLFLSLVEDIRVVLIKIIHCLYDMRHKEDVDPKMFPVYINECKYLCIPIVHRLGLYKIKQEFEEKVMLYENPVEFEEIRNKIQVTSAEQKALMEKFIAPISKALNEEKIDTSIKWRTKSIPSIYAKMKAQNVPFEQVYDLFAVRIIIKNSKLTEEKTDCWRVYSIVTNIYQPNPKRLRDWVTTPKASGYESLHTTVLTGKNWIEVQIRTERMDDIAEKGRAAHWQYKGKSKVQTTDEWLNQVRDILENPDQIVFNNFDEDKMSKKYKSDKIYVITPDGDLKQLPIGSTVLDFAFNIHTQVGSKCVGAYVNGKLQPIRYVLSNGDRVEIQTNKKQVPKSDWLSVVTTDKAKNKIRRYLKDQEMKEAELGNAIFHRKLKNWKITYTDKLLTDILKEYNLRSGIELYHLIATEKIDLIHLKDFILSIEENKDSKTVKQEEEPVKDKPVEYDSGIVAIGNNLNDLAYKMAKCCNPILGDDVLGFVNISGGVTIHRKDCPNIKTLKKSYPYRIIDVKWNKDDSIISKATIKVVGNNKFGLLGTITDIIKELGMNIINANFETENTQFEGRLVLQVPNINILEQLIKKIKSLKDIIDVHRID